MVNRHLLNFNFLNKNPQTKLLQFFEKLIAIYQINRRSSIASRLTDSILSKCTRCNQ